MRGHAGRPRATMSARRQSTTMRSRFATAAESMVTAPGLGPGPASRGLAPTPRLPVRDELEQRPVGVAEVDALALAVGAAARDRADLDLDASGRQVLDRAGDRAVPHEAQIAVPRADAVARDRRGVHARPVDVQLLVA